ncbi:hypothetical protein FT637_23205 [Bacillus cereus]|uniref:ABC transporter permease n=1 Tax=Bacillus cereus TaxID=1396 RepID=UPI00187AC1A2|nr:ABC-2 family transporter protein [Bacillus cereus]MBE7105823.1 hypothetical protein [Bacillus cereus]MBE7122109.1 hypothetical protein [Bacillus cereus]
MYSKLMRTTFKSATVYKFNVLTKIIATLIAVFAVRQVWTVLYENPPANGVNVTLDVMLTYMTISIVLQSLYTPTIVWEVSQKIQNGQIAQEFQRPWNFEFAMLSRSFGLILANVMTVVIPIGVITVFIFPISISSSWIMWCAFLFSIFAGIIINFCVQFFISLLAFVFVEVWGFEIVIGLATSFLSGQLIPLWFFPEFLQKIAQFLPFRGMYDIPLSIITGQVNFQNVLGLLAFQIMWAVGLIIIIRLVVRYFQRVLVVAGG